MIESYNIKSQRSMQGLGAKIINRLVAENRLSGSVITLSGPLGCGKSVFTRGAMRALGIAEHIVSPTFTLVQEYDSAKYSIKAYHFDLYRLSGADEFDLLGANEILSKHGTICFIEWPEIVFAGDLKTLGYNSVDIKIQVASPTERLVTIDY